MKLLACLKSFRIKILNLYLHNGRQSKVININFVEDEPKYEDYKNVLFNRSNMRHDMK